jgi:hypothetical protein
MCIRIAAAPLTQASLRRRTVARDQPLLPMRASVADRFGCAALRCSLSFTPQAPANKQHGCKAPTLCVTPATLKVCLSTLRYRPRLLAALWRKAVPKVSTAVDQSQRPSRSGPTVCATRGTLGTHTGCFRLPARSGSPVAQYHAAARRRLLCVLVRPSWQSIPMGPTGGTHCT